MTAGAVIHLDDQTLHLGHTLSSDPPKGPPWATAGLLLPSLLNTHPSQGCSVPIEESHEAPLLIRSTLHPQSPSTKLVIFTWNKGSENIKV